MKVLFALITFAFAGLAHAGELRNYDCNKGDDGIGGYYCHYEFIKCAADTCEEAAKCIVEKVAKERIGVPAKAYIADSSPVSRDGENMTLTRLQTFNENCHGRQCLTPMLVYSRVRKAEWGYQAGKCEPVAINIVGSEGL